MSPPDEGEKVNPIRKAQAVVLRAYEHLCERRIKLSKELEERILEQLNDLLKHKRKEHEKNIEAVRKRIGRLESRLEGGNLHRVTVNSLNKSLSSEREKLSKMVKQDDNSIMGSKFFPRRID